MKAKVGIICPSGQLDELTIAMLQRFTKKGISACGFALADVDMTSETVQGQTWDGTQLQSVTCSLPEICEFRFPVGTHARARERYGQLIDYIMQHTKALYSTGLGKVDLAGCILQSQYSACGIFTYMVNTYEQAVSCVAVLQDCIVKPIGGRQGKCVICVRQENTGIYVYDGDEKQPLTPAYWEAYIQKMQEERLGTPILQPRLDFSTLDGTATDFRLLVAKGASGTWEIVKIYGRVGSNAVTSNVSRGGSRQEVMSILNQLSEEHAQRLYQEFCTLAVEIPKLIERKKGEESNCFGIDVGVDRKSLQSYIIEVNTYPQHSAFVEELAETKAGYICYLLEKMENEEA